MADKFWVANTGNLNDPTNHISLTSGGAPGAGNALTNADDFKADANSGSGTITANASTSMKALLSSGSSIGTFIHNSSVTLSIGGATPGAGNVAFDNSGFTTWTTINAAASILDFIASHTTPQTINTNGKILGTMRLYAAVNPLYTMLSHTVLNGAYQQASGFSGSNVDWNDFNIEALTYTFGFGAVVYMGSGTVSIKATAAGTMWSMGNSAFTAPIAETSTILVANASANTRTFDGGGKAYNNFQYTVAGSTGQLTITAGAGSNSFNTLSFSDVTNARTLAFTAGQTNTINNFNVNGTSGKLMSVVSTSAGSPTTLHLPNPTNVDYVSFKDITVTGNTPLYAGANSVDAGGNTGIVFAPRPNSGMLAIL
jgi:hypothetical protein